MSEAGIAARWRVIAGAGRAALIPFFTAGYPSRAASLAALRGAADAGADLVEVGVPFSDPLADGPTIQGATHAALQGGMTAAGVLALVHDAGLAIPVVLMTYLNPVLAYGARRFAADALAAGAAGVLLTDAPAGADPATEAAIARRLRDVRAGKTTVVVSSSPLVLSVVDEVAFLDGGEIVARDTHAALLSGTPAYRAVVSREEVVVR